MIKQKSDSFPFSLGIESLFYCYKIIVFSLIGTSKAITPNGF